MEHKKVDQQKKEHVTTGGCSTGSMQKTSGSCGSDVKKSEQTGSCGSSGDKSKKGSCG